jgi:ABC-type nitrate/sulfonate/bicarbonate transport system substrate-binding protein
MVFPFSCHNYQLRDWLAGAGVDPDRDVRLIVVPPPMLVEALRTGQVDGFCVGEPWNSLAVDAGLGTIVATATDIWIDPPEKVLGMRVSYVEQHPDICSALVRAVVSAATWLSEPSHFDKIVQLLGQPRYVGAPERLLRAALDGQIVTSTGRPPVAHAGFIRLDAAATVPRRSHARMFTEQVARWQQIAFTEVEAAQAQASFREDLYAESLLPAVNKARGNQG